MREENAKIKIGMIQLFSLWDLIDSRFRYLIVTCRKLHRHGEGIGFANCNISNYFYSFIVTVEKWFIIFGFSHHKNGCSSITIILTIRGETSLGSCMMVCVCLYVWVCDRQGDKWRWAYWEVIGPCWLLRRSALSFTDIVLLQNKRLDIKIQYVCNTSIKSNGNESFFSGSRWHEAISVKHQPIISIWPQHYQLLLLTVHCPASYKSGVSNHQTLPITCTCPSWHTFKKFWGWTFL